MPGNSFRSEFETPITASYVITFCTLMGALRIEVTVPVNVCPGYASTVNVAGWLTRTRPTSASDTFVSTCIFVRS